MTFDQVLIHIQSPTTVFASSLKALQFDMAQSAISKKCCIRWIFDLKLNLYILNTQRFMCHLLNFPSSSITLLSYQIKGV